MIDWRLGLNQTNPFNALLQGVEHGNALRTQREENALAQEDRQFNRQRLLEQDKRQARQDERQAKIDARQEKVWSQEDQDRIRTNLVREGIALRSMPQDQRIASFRQRIIPQLRELGIPPEQLEPHLNDEAFSDAEIDAFVAQMGGGTAAPKITTATPGSWVLDAQGNVIQQVPFAPRLEQVDPGKDVYQMGGGGPMAAPDLDFGQLETAIVRAIPGTRVTSRTRTPEQNAALPNAVPNSYHLTGQARDFVPPQGMSTAQLAAQLRSSLPPGVEVIDEGNHVHIEPAPGGPRRVQQGRPKEAARPATAEEKAAYGLPPDYPAQIVDGEFNPITGAESIVKRDEKADARSMAEQNRRTQAAFINGTVDEALSKLGGGEAGIVGNFTSKIPQTRAYDLARTLDTIKANLGFQELAAMRAASPTGGALGAIAVQELVALQATVASLDQGQSEAQLRANLNKVKQHYQRWLDAVGKAEANPAPAASGRAPAAQGGWKIERIE